MAPGQGPLDAVLLVAEPVQRGVDLPFFDDTQVQHAAQAEVRVLSGIAPAAHTSYSSLDSAMVLFQSIVQVGIGSMCNRLAERGTGSPAGKHRGDRW